MGDNSRIEWTDATWNPVWGCTEVSEGCDHCYARTLAERFGGPDGFTLRLVPDKLDQPLRWRKPRRIFVNSMSDLFHKEVPDEYIARVFAVMALAPQHTFQVLTKRPGRMRSLLRSEEFADWVDAFIREEYSDRWAPNGYECRWPLPNVWLGTSVESQKWADVRIPPLLETPAAVRFLSCEPMLGPIALTRLHAYCPTHDFIGGFCSGPCPDVRLPDWIICGGESGPGARPMQLDWAQSLRDQCVSIGIAFHFKQWGEWKPLTRVGVGVLEGNERFGEIVDDGKFPDHVWRRMYHRVGKKVAGRELDGRTWDEYPEVSA